MLGIVSSVGACVAAASVASYVAADSEPPAFKELVARDLWPTTPVKVDPREQRYERIPPLYSSYVTEAPATMMSAARSDSVRPSTELPPLQPKLSAEHLAWCGECYRSFDPETNAHQSYGGETRVCSSPFRRNVAEADEGVGTKVNAEAAAGAPLATSRIDRKTIRINQGKDRGAATCRISLRRAIDYRRRSRGADYAAPSW